MLSVYLSKKFKKDVKRLQKQGKDMQKLKDVIEMLCNGQILPEKYRDHRMTGDWQGFKDCHIEPDWLLVYQYINNELVLVLVATGSHSELF